MLVKNGLNLIKGIEELKLSGIVRTGEALSGHTTLKIGGRAEVFIIPSNVEDLNRVLRFTKENAIPLFILGGGSKVLIPDEGISGVVVKLKNTAFRKIEFIDKGVNVGGGVKVNDLLREMQDKETGGWEFFAGIPATIGGMVITNAGIKDNAQDRHYIQIGDFIDQVTVMEDNGDISVLKRKDIDFGYRYSGLSGLIILEVRLNGAVSKEKEEIYREISRFIEYRTKTQELSIPNAGCVFKNPASDNRSSGALIELAGLKGRRMGGVMVSEKHANFILNTGRGNASDFLMLVDLIQEKVRLTHNIWLEPEIRILGK